MTGVATKDATDVIDLTSAWFPFRLYFSDLPVLPPPIRLLRFPQEIIPLRTAYKINSGTEWRFNFCKI